MIGVYLVGSRATGTAGPESDWDFIVVTDPPRGHSAFEGLNYRWLTREDAARLGITPVGVPADAYIMRRDVDSDSMILLFTDRAVRLWYRVRRS